MAYNGQGTFVRLYSWAQDKLAGIKISADRMDKEMDGFAVGLSTALTRDGQSKPSANIDWNDKRITNLGDAAADKDAVSRSYGDKRYGLGGKALYASGASGAYVLTTGQSLAALSDGQVFSFFANHTANTTTPSLNVDGIGGKTIKGVGGATLASGAIVSGGVYSAAWNTTANAFYLLGSTLPPVASGDFKLQDGKITIAGTGPTLSLQQTTGGQYGALLHTNTSTLYILRTPASSDTYDNGPNGRYPMTMGLTTGDVVFSGNVGAYSDERLKCNVRRIEAALDKVCRMQGVWFARVETGEESAGVIAQALQPIAPELVHEDADGYLSVDYPNLVAYLIEAIKELAEDR